MKELNYQERKELAILLEDWLSRYTEEIISYVLTNKLEAILEDETAMHMLKELSTRKQKEKGSRIRHFEYMIMGLQDNESIDSVCRYIHDYPLTHSKSYRDVLFDMFIADMETDKETNNN